MVKGGSHSLKYYDLVVAVFIAVLIISNVVSTKLVGIGPLLFDAGTILFPLAYILGDVLTEVYGYKLARRTIWLGFIGLVLMSLTLVIVQALPSADGWNNQDAYNSILGFVPRIAAASILGYLVGEFTNSVILAKLKVKTSGRFLWLRTITSTIFGSALDTVVFSLVAFGGLLSSSEMRQLILTVYLIKLAVEVVFTPITYWVVTALKRAEAIDVYDDKTRFSLW